MPRKRNADNQGPPAKKRKTAADTAEDDNEDEGLAQTIDEIQKLKDQGKYAPLDTDLGIYICPGQINAAIMQNGNNLQAGYFGARNLEEFKTLYNAIWEILEKRAETVQKIFNGTTLKLNNVSLSPLGIIRDAKTLLAQEIRAEDIINPDDLDVDMFDDDANHLKRAQLEYLRIAHLILERMKEEKQDGTFGDFAYGSPVELVKDGKQLSNVESKIVVPGWEYHAEDVYRALMARVWAARKKEAKPKGKSDGASVPKPIRLNGLPTPPIYVHPSLAVINTKSKDQMQRLALDAFKAEADPIALDQLFKKAKGQATDVNESLHAASEVFSKAKSLIGDIDKWDDDTREQILHNMTRDAASLFMWRDQSHSIPTRNLTSIASSTVDQAVLDQEAAAEGEKDQTDQPEFRYNQEFRHLQQTLNSRASCKGPTLKEALKHLKANVKVIECEPSRETEHLPYRFEFLGLPLKFWQLPAVSWCVKMSQSILRGGILADDVGIGKTIQAMAAAVQLSAETESDGRKWDAEFEPHIRQFVNALRERIWAVIQDTYGAVKKEDIPRDPAELRLWVKELPLIEGEIRLDLEAFNASVAEAKAKFRPRPPHKPVLIVAPNVATSAWIRDAEKYFNVQDRKSPHRNRHIDMHLWFQTDSRTMEKGKNTRPLRNHIQSFAKLVDRLDPNDPQTSRTLILTTLQSLQRKVIQRNGQVATEKKKKTQPGQGPQTDGDEAAIDPDDEIDDQIDEDPDVDEQAEELKAEFKTANGLKLLYQPYAKRLSGVMIDEAHRVKNPETLQTEACYLQDPDWFILISGTPMKTSPRDLGGLMRFFWKQVVRGNPDMTNNDEQAISASEYETGMEVMKDSQGFFLDVSEEEQRNLAVFINWAPFQFLVNNGVAQNNTKVIDQVVPLPGTILCLSRRKGNTIQVFDQVKVIGDTIPPWRCTFVELRGDSISTSYYLGADEMIKDKHGMRPPPPPTNDLQKKPTVDPAMRGHRHNVNNPYLYNFIDRHTDSRSQVVTKCFNGAHSAFGFYYAWTKQDLHSSSPIIRQQMLQYIVGSSAKCRALLWYLFHWGIMDKQKIIIWAHEPLTLILVDIICALVDLPHVTIRAHMDPAARVAAERSYNHDDRIRIANMSSRSASESSNMQHGGCKMVVMDQTALNTLLQMIGRGSRIGQRFDQDIHVLCLDESIDQYLTSSYALQYRTQVVATAEVPASLTSRYLQTLSEQERVNLQAEASASGRSEDALVRGRIVNVHAEEVIRSLFGWRTSRTHNEWRNRTDYDAKNLLDEEIIYRLAYGKEVGNETFAQLQGRDRGDPEDEPATINPKDRLKYEIKQRQMPQTPHGLKKKTRADAPPINDKQEAANYMMESARKLAQTLKYRMLRMNNKEILLDARNWTGGKTSEILDIAIEQCTIEDPGKFEASPLAAKSKRAALSKDRVDDSDDEDGSEPTPAPPHPPSQPHPRAPSPRTPPPSTPPPPGTPPPGTPPPGTPPPGTQHDDRAPPSSSSVTSELSQDQENTGPDTPMGGTSEDVPKGDGPVYDVHDVLAGLRKDDLVDLSRDIPNFPSASKKQNYLDAFKQLGTDDLAETYDRIWPKVMSGKELGYITPTAGAGGSKVKLNAGNTKRPGNQ